MDILYNTGILAYKTAARVVSLKSRKARLLLQGQARTFPLLRERLDPAGGYIWIHASSLGEFEQGRPLIEMIKQRQPGARILLTFFSPSGYEVRKGYDQVDAVCYLPFDLRSNVRRFLDLVKPSMAVFVKYEFWGNYLMELRRRQVPTYIISSIFRPGQVFFRPWGGMFRKMLRCFDTLFVQNEQSRQLLAGIGIDRVVVAGDTRFDRVATVREKARQFPTLDRFVANSPFTLVMGSSWLPDEDIVIPYFNAHPGMKLIIAPHEFDRERLLAIMSRIERRAALFSQARADHMAHTHCLVIDSFGLLSSLYRYGQAAYVGGGFGAGIHNVNEAAVYGIPVLFGPRHEKFQEARDLLSCGGAFCIQTADEFKVQMDRLLMDPNHLQHTGEAARDYITSHLGATQRIYDTIFPH
ncbi:MAG: 3-deoxy-D-manno-octulosonic acid transferase [Muribaculaceae bacterium]|nr:3-deoxy-D-manno-octulosonic acid transferase [Muribaculaceae bacterium]